MLYLTEKERAWLQTLFKTIITNEKNVYYGLLFKKSKLDFNWSQGFASKFDLEKSRLILQSDQGTLTQQSERFYLSLYDPSGLVITKLYLPSIDKIQANLIKQAISEEITISVTYQDTTYIFRIWQKTLSQYDNYLDAFNGAIFQDFPTLKVTIGENIYLHLDHFPK